MSEELKNGSLSRIHLRLDKQDERLEALKDQNQKTKDEIMSKIDTFIFQSFSPALVQLDFLKKQITDNETNTKQLLPKCDDILNRVNNLENGKNKERTFWNEITTSIIHWIVPALLLGAFYLVYLGVTGKI